MPRPSKPPAHRTPKDLRDAIAASKNADATWCTVTPLAKSEWACWVMSAKKTETRVKRIHVAIDQLARGQKRPCCWPGCPHRKQTTA